MAQEFFDGFTPDQKREVGRAIEQVATIRDAYQTAVILGQEVAGADLVSSHNPAVRKEVGEAIAAANTSSASLMHELVEYTDAFAMSPTARGGASRFVAMLERARLGDAAALATLQSARNELGEAERARADFGNDNRNVPRDSTVSAGDRPMERDRDQEALIRSLEVIAAQGARVNTLALPESFVDRYVRAGDSLVDARSPARLILVDRGRRLDAPPQYSSETIKAMVAIAEARGWSRIVLKGEPEFKAAVYMEAASRSMTVSGYKPSAAERAVADSNHARQRIQVQSTTATKNAASTISEAFKQSRTPAERKAAAKQFPQLTQAFAMEAVAATAAKNIANRNGSEAFLRRFRDTIAEDLSQGRSMADIRLRKPVFRDQRDRDQAADRGC